MKKDGTYTPIKRDGLQVCVMRPGNPQLAIKLSLEAVAANEQAIARGEPPIDADFDEIVQKCGGSTFVGYYGRRGMLFAVVDENGEKIGDIEPGDSFATLEGMRGEDCCCGAKPDIEHPVGNCAEWHPFDPEHHAGHRA